jgi:ubiquinol-cytochrome c reductase cytochrome b subunit
VAKSLVQGVDQRFHAAGSLRKESSHVFPKHFSFFWGELALYSFIVLVLSGTVLALWFVPDTTEVVYRGQFLPLRDLHMSRAYDSALDISFDVRAGLLIRQMHHWAADIFVVSIVTHMFRNFFTGAFRRPRELTWVTGVVLLMVSLLEGYSGYSQIDDLLSGMGVRIFNGLILGVPVIGSWLEWFIWDGEYPGQIWISRFFLGHVFLIPAIITALIAAHLGLVWYLKHTHFPRPGASESNVMGERTLPGFGMKTVGNGLLVVGVIGIMGGIFQINPIFLWGPYTPAGVSTGAQPDWYVGFLIGALRLFPAWDIHLGKYRVAAPFWPGIVLPLLMFTMLGSYPWLEQFFTKDRRSHQLLQRPRDAPARTALGAMAITFYLVLVLAGADDMIALALTIPFEWLRWAGRVSVFVLPPIAYLITRRICLGLQRTDRELLRRGVRTGLLRELPDGGYAEVRQPPGGVDAEGRPIPMAYEGVRVDQKVAVSGRDEEPS